MMLQCRSPLASVLFCSLTEFSLPSLRFSAESAVAKSIFIISLTKHVENMIFYANRNDITRLVSDICQKCTCRSAGKKKNRNENQLAIVLKRLKWVLNNVHFIFFTGKDRIYVDQIALRVALVAPLTAFFHQSVSGRKKVQLIITSQ